jgi:basic amino acid/polyamine antiporter, APA family
MNLNSPAPQPATQPGLIKGLGIVDGTMIIVGSMIGSGIFIVTADIAKALPNPALLLLTWIITGVMTIIAALCYGELAAAMPEAGGQYVFLREAYGPLWGFLYGWTLFLVIQTGTIAAVAVAFARYLDVFFPLSKLLWICPLPGIHWSLDGKQLVGVFLILLLSGINCFGIKTGARVQNVFTFSKIAALIALILVGLTYSGGSFSHFSPFWPDRAALSRMISPVIESNQSLLPSNSLWLNLSLLFGVAMIGALFSSDAWNNLTFTGSEVKNPQRTLPLALFLGTGMVTLLYLLTNLAYLYVLPIEQLPATDKIAARVVQMVLGPIGGSLVSLAILVSTFGCLNGIILSGPRVYYAMARDGLFFKALSSIHPSYHTPVRSLLVQALWASLLTLSGTYSQLLTYVISAALLFYILTVWGVIRLRKTMPDLVRPYRTFGYPVLPLIYVMMAAIVLACNLAGDPRNSWPGFLLILIGLPAYFYWKRKHGFQSAKNQIN